MFKFVRLISTLWVLFALVIGFGMVHAQEGSGRQPITPENAQQLVAYLTVGRGDIGSVAFSPDGTILAGGDLEGSIWLWDTETGEELLALDAPAGEVNALAFSPDGTLLASGGSKGVVQVWEVATGTVLEVLQNPAVAVSEGQAAYVCNLAFTTDGSLLGVGTCETSGEARYDIIRLWDVISWETIKTIEGNRHLIFEPDGTTLLTVRENDILRWDMAGTAGEHIGDSDGGIAAITLSADGTMLAFADYSAHFVITDMATSIIGQEAHENYVDTMAFNADASVLVTVEQSLYFDPSAGLMSMTWLPAEKLATLWETATGKSLVTLNIETVTVLRDMAISADGALLAFGTDEGAQLWRIPDLDGDGIEGKNDNCPAIANADQADSDGDSFGDVCDECPAEAGTAAGCPDADDDGVADTSDNCPDAANTDQADFNADGTGDACQDTDQDGTPDAADLCPEKEGSAQGCPDTDGDGFSDNEDMCPDNPGTTAGCPDTDEDGVTDDVDNCIDTPNPNQIDANKDGIGDGCQNRDDDDFMDDVDECPTKPGTVNGCPDSDEDGVPDRNDTCPDEAGSSATGGCPDTDGDNIADKFDRCPEEAGTVSGCPDADGDTVADPVDQCPDEAGMAELDGCLFTAVVSPGSGTVNLREGPGTNFALAGTANADNELTLLGRNQAGDWLYIRLETGDGETLEAWVAAWLVTTEAEINVLPVID